MNNLTLGEKLIADPPMGLAYEVVRQEQQRFAVHAAALVSF
jgi:hypothetical protein